MKEIVKCAVNKLFGVLTRISGIQNFRNCYKRNINSESFSPPHYNDILMIIY